ncbi:MAG: Fic family protein, partial [Pseudomonadota bacterium]|nr:Fic family protein [Pseudomonadota bacterium]
MKLPLSPPPLRQLLADLKPANLTDIVGLGPLVRGRYLHWDELRHRTPPEGFNHETWWTGVKLARQALLRDLPFQDRHRRPIRVGIPDPVLRALHIIDRQAAGTVAMDSPIA